MSGALARWRLPAGRPEVGLALVAAALVALLELAGLHRLGGAGVVVPLALVLAAIMLARPVLAMVLVVALTIVCEGASFGILTFASNLYVTIYKYITVLDILVALAVVSVALDLMRHRRAPWLPRPLVLPTATLALAMVAGLVTGHAAGASWKYGLVSEHVLAYLLLVPPAVANLDVDRRQVAVAIGCLLALAIVKAGFGLVEVIGDFGTPIEGATDLTYYEPAPNWLITIGLLGVVAAGLARARLPRWAVLGSPLLLACLVLSYRRSFWIGAVVGLLLVVLLGTSPTGRRLLLPSALAVAAAIWLLGTINFQSQLPLARRVASLAPSKLEANVQDSYRLDERANVLAEIRRHPITGLGVTIPWAATAQPLSIEHEEGRDYVHFAALWYWLKLGILGVLAYVAIIAAALRTAWLAWRRSPEPLLRAFALASLCGCAGLIAIDTTASFTGVDPRFTLLFAVQLGLLALLGRPPRPGETQAGSDISDTASRRQSASSE